MRFIIVNDGNGCFYPCGIMSAKQSDAPDLLTVSYYYPRSYADALTYQVRNTHHSKEEIYDSYEDALAACEDKLRELVKKRTKAFLDRNKFARELLTNIEDKKAVKQQY